MMKQYEKLLVNDEELKSVLHFGCKFRMLNCDEYCILWANSFQIIFIVSI